MKEKKPQSLKQMYYMCVLNALCICETQFSLKLKLFSSQSAHAKKETIATQMVQIYHNKLIYEHLQRKS